MISMRNLNASTLLAVLGVALYIGTWRIYNANILNIFNLNIGIPVLILALVVHLVSSRNTTLRKLPRSANLYFVVILFLGVSSLIWSLDFGNGINQMSGIFSGIIFFLVVYQYIPSHAFRISVTLLYSIVVIFALYEILTGNHIRSAAIIEAESKSWSTEGLVFSIFGNPNDLGVFLIFSILTLFLLSRNLSLKEIGVACLAIYLCTKTGSRISISLCVLLIFIWVTSIIPKINFYWRAGIGVSGLIITFYYVYFYILANLDNLITSDISTRSRIALLESGIYLLKLSNYMGIGAGSFGEAILRGYAPYQTEGFINPHMLLNEISAEYGILPLLSLVLLLANLSWNTISQSTKLSDLQRLIILIFPLIYVIASTAPSTFLASPLNWAMLTSVFITVRDAYEKN